METPQKKTLNDVVEISEEIFLNSYRKLHGSRSTNEKLHACLANLVSIFIIARIFDKMRSELLPEVFLAFLSKSNFAMIFISYIEKTVHN